MGRLESDALDILTIIKAANLLPKKDSDILLQKISENYLLIYTQSYRQILKQFKRLNGLFVSRNHNGK